MEQELQEWHFRTVSSVGFMRIEMENDSGGAIRKF
jgi:hypothetical protein